MKAEDHQQRRDELAGWAVNIVSYRVGDTWHCTVDNVDPGANVARGTGDTRAEAEASAIEDATRRMERTRRHDVCTPFHRSTSGHGAAWRHARSHSVSHDARVGSGHVEGAVATGRLICCICASISRASRRRAKTPKCSCVGRNGTIAEPRHLRWHSPCMSPARSERRTPRGSCCFELYLFPVCWRSPPVPPRPTRGRW